MGRVRRCGLVADVRHGEWVLIFQKPTSGSLSLSVDKNIKLSTSYCPQLCLFVAVFLIMMIRDSTSETVSEPP